MPFSSTPATRNNALSRSLRLAVLMVGGAMTGCPEPARPPPAVALAATTLDAALPGYTCAGGRGDLLIQLGPLRAVVATAGTTPERRLLRGSLVDAVVGRWQDDGLAELRTVVYAADAELATQVVTVEPATVKGRQAVVVVQEVARPALRIVTQIEAAEPGPHLVIESEVENRGAAVSGLRIGDRVRWHGPHPFLPGTGFVSRWTRVEARWLGQHGKALSYALVPAEDAAVHVHSERDEAVEQLVLPPARTLPAGASHRVRRRLLVAPGDLGTVAGLAWKLAEREVVVARGVVESADARATLLASDDRGRPMLSVSLGADGRWALPLPLGSYRLKLHAPGGEDEAALEVAREGAALSEPLVAPAPGELRVLAADEAGAPIAARILLRGIAPTPDPQFGDAQVAKGFANVAYTLAGDVRLTLPAGRYRVTVTHGPERELAKEEVSIDAARGATIRARLARAVDASGWLACDLHVHAVPSFDSRVPLMDRVVALVAEGVDFAVATDHNHVTDYAPVIAELSAPLKSASGVEITTNNWGHFNAFPYPTTQPAPPYADVEPAALFALVRERAPKSLIQVNHPRMGTLGYFNHGKLDVKKGQADPALSFEFDTLEVFNGFDLNGVDKVEGYVREWLELVSAGRRYTAVGSSDSHKIAFQWAGYPRTYVRVASADGVVDGLRAGRAMVTNGPFIDAKVEGEGPGATVKARAGKVRLQVEVRAPSWIDVNDVRVALIDGPQSLPAKPGAGPLKLRYDGEIEVPRDGFVVVLVRGSITMEEVLSGADAIPFAFTNPVWIDADGDGSVKLVPNP